MKKVMLVPFALALIMVLGCNSDGGDPSGSQLNGRYSGTFRATVNGVFKDGGIGIAYEAASGDALSGEFDIDDTTGSLGGTKTFEGTKNGNQITWHSTKCGSDTFQLTHNLDNGAITFSGTLCQGAQNFNLTGGSGTVQAAP